MTPFAILRYELSVAKDTICQLIQAQRLEVNNLQDNIVKWM